MVKSIIFIEKILLFIALILSISSIIYALNTTTYPEIKTITQTKTIYRENTRTISLWKTKEITCTFNITKTERTTETITIVLEKETTIHVLEIEDIILYRNVYVIEETTYIYIYVMFSITNIGTLPVKITNITVDDLPLFGFTPINIDPFTTYTGSYPIILNPETGETRIPYDPKWNPSTEHKVKIYYQIYGLSKEYVLSTKAIVL
ncbi:MAG: hypothetical protein B6U89_02820 [Desulfurococcales archaeon ex4484_58]|nr:MAG: hypothetical protein B6U89_02820 [Desulfurococcales archaeon ex4484_58]